MKSHRTRTLIALAVLGVVTFGPSKLFAQFRTNDDGRLLDASNRIGSGGLNNTPVDDRQKVRVTGNDIVSGNVSGGVDFRGRVSSRDPGDFRGSLGSDDLDRFIKRSGGAPQAYTQQSYGSTPQPFYNESRLEAPPPGYVRGTPGSRNYVYVPGQVQGGQDLRIGAPLGDPIVRLPKPGQLQMPGPVDPTANDVVFSASPLYGVRADQYDARLDDRMGGERSYTRNVGMDDVQSMRDELARTRIPADVNADGAGRAEPTAQDSVQNPSLIGSEGMANKPLDPAQIQREQLSPEALASSVVPAPDQQSSQYAELQSRYERISNQRKLEPKGQPKEPPADPKIKTPTEGTQHMPNPGPEVKDYAAETREQAEKAMRGDDSKPLDIKSLATGVQARGLNQLLTEAEELMRAGKFETAIERYTTAEQVAPNNPLIWVGRSHAELGAGYFARAERHLRQAFAADPALLMARYDLPGFIGEERLQNIVKDLKEQANKDASNPVSVILLGYIAYNTANERRAAAYLDLASKRAGDKDPMIQQLRDAWVLPAAATDESPEMNK